MDVFTQCQGLNDLITSGDHVAARNGLIKLLGEMATANTPYPEVLNHLVRQAGLYPYMQLENASWDQKFVHEAFAVDVGRSTATLHREQSMVLALLLEGTDLAVSAPTSFGKSFIIDAFIAAKKPHNVVIIVPTIALMDETRRRIFKKFSTTYNIVTAPGTRLGERNIFIFPQERAFGYLNDIKQIDLLVVDEFYKASTAHDKDRAPSLLKAIIQLARKSRQRYYLAPNIKKLSENVFTEGVRFIELLDFNTVYLEKHELFREIGSDEEKKGESLISLISSGNRKSLIYAGTYAEIKKVAELVRSRMAPVERPHAVHFSRWLRENYQQNWALPDLVERGVGVHNGRMHRCLSQLQIKLFEHPHGFDSIVSTSSIIEGVNTSAENVIIWRSKIGRSNLKDFTYKNIIGRGGRMFKHFVGNIYLLDAPPAEEDAQLNIEFPEEILGSLDEERDRAQLTESQIERVIQYRRSMSDIIGEAEFARLKRDNLLQDSDSEFLLALAKDMKDDPSGWRGFGYLNSNSPEDWTRMLFKVVQLKRGAWDTSWTKVVTVTKELAYNWRRDLPDILRRLADRDVDIEEFFQLERAVTFKLAALVSDANELHKIIVDPHTDVSTFVGKLGHAFLPTAVYHLEEYGLPRMVTKKIHKAGLIDFTNPEFGLRESLEAFQAIGMEKVLAVSTLNAFDRYIVKFFYEGITPD
jgi:hypothetical protein